MIGSTRAIRRAEALRHDALAAECAGVPEDDRPVAGVVLVEGDALVGMTEKLRQVRLRSSIGMRRRSSPSSSSRSNAQSTAAAS